MATAANDRVMASERIAPGMLPRVLGSFDMVVIFVAVVLFIVNASAIQSAISQFTHRREMPETAAPEPTPTPATG